MNYDMAIFIIVMSPKYITGATRIFTSRSTTKHSTAQKDIMTHPFTNC